MTITAGQQGVDIHLFPGSLPPGAHGGGGSGNRKPTREEGAEPVAVGTVPVRIPSPDPSETLATRTHTHFRLTRDPAPPFVCCEYGHKVCAEAGISYPPDVWIPISDGDGILLPPPHQLSSQVTCPTALPPQPQLPASVSPTAPPIKSPSNQAIFMVPPPTSDAHNSDEDSVTSGTSYSPVTDRHRSHHRRGRSLDPQASAAVS